MDLGIISIGKLKSGPLQELQNDYKKRILKLGKNIGINDLQIKEGFISKKKLVNERKVCLLYTSPSPRDRSLTRMPSSA